MLRESALRGCRRHGPQWLTSELLSGHTHRSAPNWNKATDVYPESPRSPGRHLPQRKATPRKADRAMTLAAGPDHNRCLTAGVARQRQPRWRQRQEAGDPPPPRRPAWLAGCCGNPRCRPKSGRHYCNRNRGTSTGTTGRLVMPPTAAPPKSKQPSLAS